MKQGQPQICSLSTLAAISTIYCHCGIFVFSWPFPQTVLRQIPHPALSTTAAFPAIRCRCGESVCMTPVLEADQGSFPSIPLPTTAAFPAIQCRCGSAFSCRPILTTIHGRFTVWPYPQRQRFPRFGASAARPSLRRHFNRMLYAGFSRTIRPHHKPNDRLEFTPNISYLYDIKSFSP